MTVPRYWRNIPQYYNLVGCRCTSCNNYFFPPRDICPMCKKSEMESFQFSGDGTIVTYTVIRTPFSDPESEVIEIPAREVPFTLAIIRLKEGPMLTAEVIMGNSKNIKIGAPVRAVFRKIVENGKQGVIQYGYKFKLR